MTFTRLDGETDAELRTRMLVTMRLHHLLRRLGISSALSSVFSAEAGLDVTALYSVSFRSETY